MVEVTFLLINNQAVLDTLTIEKVENLISWCKVLLVILALSYHLDTIISFDKWFRPAKLPKMLTKNVYQQKFKKWCHFFVYKCYTRNTTFWMKNKLIINAISFVDHTTCADANNDKTDHFNRAFIYVEKDVRMCDNYSYF
jgi:hypothetical protein